MNKGIRKNTGYLRLVLGNICLKKNPSPPFSRKEIFTPPPYFLRKINSCKKLFSFLMFIRIFSQKFFVERGGQKSPRQVELIGKLEKSL